MDRLIRLAEFLGQEETAATLKDWMSLDACWKGQVNGSFLCSIVAACERSRPMTPERDPICQVGRDIFVLSEPQWYPFSSDNSAKDKHKHCMNALRALAWVVLAAPYSSWEEDFDEGMVPALTSIGTQVMLALLGVQDETTRGGWERYELEIAHIVRRHFPDPAKVLSVTNDLP